MAKILLVEDSSEIRDAVHAVLSHEHEVIWAASLQDARMVLASQSDLALVLLDIDLPDGDGTSFLENASRDFESRGIGTIFLTGTNTVMSRVKGFSLGALDFIAKPFDLVEFQVRVNAKIKNLSSERTAIQNVRGGKLEIDLSTQLAYEHEGTAKKQLDLTPVEFRLLLLFLQHAGEVVPRDQILETVWGQTAVSARSVDHHVCGLRKKIQNSGGKIESVYGVGYRIET
jgi:DNA-binding response OmpR family regulator